MTPTPRHCAACALALALLWGAPALANATLDEARRLYDEQEFTLAREALEALRRGGPEGLTAAEQVELRVLLARAQIAEGLLAEAEETFAELLAQDPMFELDHQAPPKMIAALAAARGRTFEPDWVALEALPVEPPVVAVKVVDPWRRVHQVLLHRRDGPGAAFEPLTPDRRDDRVAAFERAGVGEHYFEALGRDGVLARLGSPENPLGEVLALPGRPPARFSRSQVVAAWTLGGVTVAGLGTGLALQYQAAKRFDRARASEGALQATQLREEGLRQSAWGQGLLVAGGLASLGAAVVVAW